MSVKSALPSSKRRRLILKQERNVSQAAQETLEGVSYQSGIGHEAKVDIEKLPEAVPHGHFKPIPHDRLNGKPTFICVDLETTDLIRSGRIPHITQISAVEVNSGTKFDQYIVSKQPITFTAQQITGINVHGGTMTVHGETVNADSVNVALEKFRTYLDNFSNVFLIAHNGRRFDFPVLMSAFMNNECERKFFSCVTGLIDSLSVFRKVYPDRTSYKQEDLVKDLLQASYNAHNAIEDVIALSKLVKFTSLSGKELLQYSICPTALYNSMLFNREKARNINSLSVLVATGICKTSTAENIAGSGLQLCHLKTICNRGGKILC